jgi:hypothetical protein
LACTPIAPTEMLGTTGKTWTKTADGRVHGMETAGHSQHD